MKTKQKRFLSVNAIAPKWKVQTVLFWLHRNVKEKNVCAIVVIKNEQKINKVWKWKILCYSKLLTKIYIPLDKCVSKKAEYSLILF